MAKNHKTILKKLKNLLRKSQEDPKRSLLVRTYKDQNGHVYYRFKDPREMPGQRLRVAEVAAVEADLSINAKDAIELIDLTMEKFESWSKAPKTKGLAEALHILVELKRRFVALAEEKTLLKLATCYFTMDNEDPEHYIQSQQNRKIDAWDADQDAKSFFLCRGAEITQFYSDTSDRDILMYLKKEQPNLEKVTDFLSKRTYKST